MTARHPVRKACVLFGDITIDTLPLLPFRGFQKLFSDIGLDLDPLTGETTQSDE
jgi:hypothetical protein